MVARWSAMAMLLVPHSAQSVAPAPPACAIGAGAQTLSCPHGTVVGAVDTALFGEFEAATCATPNAPAAGCPTPVNVAAQVERLCKGRASCEIGCNCSAPTACQRDGTCHMPPRYKPHDPPPATASALLCTCASGALQLAVPAGAPCTAHAKNVAIRASCVPAGPPPPPPPPPTTTVPTALRLQFLEAPVLGVDKLRPHFGWALPVPATGLRLAPTAAQSAAEVVLRDSLGQQLWSSGRIPGATPMYVPNASLPLASDRAYSWAVRVWDEGLSPSDFSTPANFSTGLLAPSDWGSAKWIIGSGGEARMIRKEFVVGTELADKIGRVSLFASACQYLLLYLDGERIGDHELDVVWTKFAENRSYVSYELEPALLAPGKHVLSMELGQGFCGGSYGKQAIADKQVGVGHTRSALLRLALHDSSAESAVLQAVVTDGSWQMATTGPVLWDSTYYGEHYDARLELKDWTALSYTPPPATWKSVTVQMKFPVDDSSRTAPMAAPFMNSQLQQPIRAVKEIKPVAMHRVVHPEYWPKDPEHPKDVTSYVYDFGQEFAGIARLSLPPNTERGTNVTLLYAEALAHPGLASSATADAWHNGGGGDVYTGEVYMKNLFWAHPIDSYVASGGGDSEGEVWQARFTEHGFRYLQLFVANGSLPSEPTLQTVLGINLRTDSREQSHLHFSDPLIQRLSDNSWWGETAALMSIPNGAAGRGERAGWTGDSAFASESECFDFDTGAFFTQFLGQLRDGQCPDGTIGSVVPATDPRRDGPLPSGGNCSGLTGDATWDTVYPTIAYNLLQYYDAIGVVRDHWPTLKQYVGFLEAQYAKSGGLKNYFCKYGDWNPVVKTPCQVTSSMSFLHDVHRMAEMAAAIGEESDAKHYRDLLGKLKPEWHEAFWSANTSAYSTGTQMAQAAAIWLDDVGEGHIVPPANMPALVKKLADDCLSEGVTIGFVGVRYLFEALAKQNRTDAALACIARPGYPGFHYEIFNLYEPSSSLWESWNVDTQKCVTCETSRDHHYRASINTFLRKYVAGLDMALGDDDGTGTAVAASRRGWSAIRVRPEAAHFNLRGAAMERLSSASASIETHRGAVHAAWKHDDEGLFTLNVSVPMGSTAEVHLPILHGDVTVVTEAGSGVVWTVADRLAKAVGGGSSDNYSSVVHKGDDGRFVQFATLSGSYEFAVQANAESV